MKLQKKKHQLVQKVK